MKNKKIVDLNDTNRDIDFLLKNTKEEYLVFRCHPSDSVIINELYEKGFTFLDRIHLYEINLKNRDKSPIVLPNGIELTEDSIIDDKMRELAYSVFVMDRRFHMETVFNQEKANKNIDEYLKDAENGCRIYKAIHENELLGFTIVKDRDSGCFENILGAVRQDLKGKMIAGPLYSTMLEKESESHSRYLGRVSTSNLFSIRLHSGLGATVKDVIDEYIFRKEEK